ncbi:uncharacterized protein H6S33_008660 [Morchella sextelata]|uniref:uncharacterized protein n=1 Tax=Morchella sextelata TaxID=1174677 RepID=UPI001D04883F|nr:uncharacterized protein H6S33_008660 [Morchella sextelata]KAH0602579.1 hypothetical protein H6S33_008660 [Morchella sextelata]
MAPNTLTTGQDDVAAPAPIPPGTSAAPHLEDAPRQPNSSTGQNTTTAASVLQQQSHPSSSPSPSPSPAEKPAPQPLQLLYTFGWLTVFSILGTLARLGLTALTTYPGAPLVGGVIWANFTGSAIMGFLVEDQRLSRHNPSLPLYIGLTTGFCGSLTSFSSFLLGVFENLSNTLPAYDGRPTRGYNLLAALGYLIATLSLSFSGLQVGAQVAMFARPLRLALPRLDWAAVPLAGVCWVGAALLCAFVPRWREVALYACLFAPVGTATRFLVGRWVNPVVKTFPLGTFAVNVVGTAVLAGVGVGRYRVVGGEAACGVVRGVGDGFCGCLTTVSTFVVEVRGLRRGHAYVYAGLSVLVGMAVMVLVLGSYTWTHNVNTAIC